MDETENAANAPDSFEQRKMEMEREKLALEREKLALEYKKLDEEHRKVKWAALAAMIPLAVAAATIGFGAFSLYESAKDQFALKAAEISLNAPDPGAAANRARVLHDWFPELLPRNFYSHLAQFDPSKRGTVGNPVVVAKKELFKAIAEHPDHRREIVATWQALFPDDDWWTNPVVSDKAVPPSSTKKR